MILDTIFFKKIFSTHLWAKQNSKDFDPTHVTCITADAQTAGIGRAQRTWVSPPEKNIYATFYFRLPSCQELHRLSQLLSWTCAQILLNKKIDLEIKWPNDLLLSKKKLGGILCHTIVQNDLIDVFLSFGLNVNMVDFSSIDQKATSLKNETHHSWNRKKLLKEIQKKFLENLSLFKQEGFFKPFHENFSSHLAYRKEKIRYFDGTRIWEGIFEDFSPDGFLILKKMPSQDLVKLSSGDLI